MSPGWGAARRARWGPFLKKGRQKHPERSSHLYSRSGWGGVPQLADRAPPGWWLSPLAGCNANTKMTRGPRVGRQPLPPLHPATVPGSFSHLGTLPRSLLTGWAVSGRDSGSPAAPASAVGSKSRGAGSGAGIGGGAPAALGMHLGGRRPRCRRADAPQQGLAPPRRGHSPGHQQVSRRRGDGAFQQPGLQEEACGTPGPPQAMEGPPPPAAALLREGTRPGNRVLGTHLPPGSPPRPPVGSSAPKCTRAAGKRSACRENRRGLGASGGHRGQRPRRVGRAGRIHFRGGLLGAAWEAKRHTPGPGLCRPGPRPGQVPTASAVRCPVPGNCPPPLPALLGPAVPPPTPSTSRAGCETTGVPPGASPNTSRTFSRHMHSAFLMTQENRPRSPPPSAEPVRGRRVRGDENRYTGLVWRKRTGSVAQRTQSAGVCAAAGGLPSGGGGAPIPAERGPLSRPRPRHGERGLWEPRRFESPGRGGTGSATFECPPPRTPKLRLEVPDSAPGGHLQVTGVEPWPQGGRRTGAPTPRPGRPGTASPESPPTRGSGAGLSLRCRTGMGHIGPDVLPGGRG